MINELTRTKQQEVPHINDKGMDRYMILLDSADMKGLGPALMQLSKDKGKDEDRNEDRNEDKIDKSDLNDKSDNSDPSLTHISESTRP